MSGSIEWFQIYFFDHGVSRRYFCKGPGSWAPIGSRETCGSMTFRKIGETDTEDEITCVHDHKQTVIKGYSTERKAVDALF